MINEAVLLAGGMGTRLQKVVNDVPKPMAPVAGRPFVEYVLDDLIYSGVEKFIFSIGYKYDSFLAHFGNRYKNCEIAYSIEEQPLGTGGGIKKALELSDSSDVLVLNADTLFKIEIAEFSKIHHSMDSDITMALRQVDDTGRYGRVVIDDHGKVVAFAEKNNTSGKGYINGGAYIMKQNFFEKMDLPEKFSLEKDCLEKKYSVLKINGYISDAYFLDIGIPEDYEKAQTDLS